VVFCEPCPPALAILGPIGVLPFHVGLILIPSRRLR
jgi:hypothetical protein